MKAIMISSKPRFVEKTLNGEKTIDVRKTMPINFEGWVYIYCTNEEYPEITLYSQENEFGGYMEHTGNGKVVARFYLRKVRKYTENDTIRSEIIKDTCLTSQEIWQYAKGKPVYFWHIENLEIFDEPKNLWQFKTLESIEKYNKDLKRAQREDAKIRAKIEEPIDMEYYGVPNCVQLTKLVEGLYGLTKAPQSWRYIEYAED